MTSPAIGPDRVRSFEPLNRASALLGTRAAARWLCLAGFLAIASGASAQPNPQVVAISAPALAASSDSVPVTVTVRNAGSSATEAPVRVGLLAVSAGTSGVASSAEFDVSVEASEPLAPGESRDLETRVRVLLPAGSAKLAAFVDPQGELEESVETDNDFVGDAVLQVVDPTGNLVVDGLELPGSASLGESVPLTVTVRNAGTGPLRFSSGFAVVLSTTTAPGPGAIVVNYGRGVEALPAGARATDSLRFTVPLDIEPGRYYVVPIADYNREAGETSESDNALQARPIDLATPTVDLTVDAVDAPTAVTVGRPFQATVDLSNGGTTAASMPFVLSIVVTRDLTSTDTEPSIGSRTIDALAAGGSLSTTVACRVPATISPGDYALSALVDADALYGELDKANNRRASSGGLAVSTADVDLTIQAIRVPAGGVIGGLVRARFSVSNLGTGAAPEAFYVGSYLSTDGEQSDDDTYLGERFVASLEGGQTTTFTAESQLPLALTSGAYFYLAVTDRDQVIDEANESNNLFATPFSARASRIDLVPVAVTAPVSGAPLEFVPLFVSVENRGADDSPPFLVSFSASPGPVLTDTAISIGQSYFTQGGLAAGERRLEGPFFADIPEGSAEGAYTLFATVDQDDRASESNESNNNLAAVASFAITTVASSVDDHPDAYTLTRPSEDLLPGDGRPMLARHERVRDVDFFRFEAGAGDQIVLDVFGQPSSFVDTLVELLGPDGKQLGSNDNFGDISRSRVGPIAAPSTGTYFVAVRETQPFGQGPYVLRARLERGQPDLTVAVSAPVPASVPQGLRFRTTVTVSNEGQAISLGGAKVKLFLSADSAITTGDIPVGEVEAPDLPAGASVRRAAELLADGFEAAPGSYFVGAIADPGRIVPQVNFANDVAVASDRLTVTHAPDDHPGRAALTRPLEDRLTLDGDWVDARVERPGDEDFFRFDVLADQIYMVETRPGTLATRHLTVFRDGEIDAAGESDADGEPATTRVIFQAYADGVAYVRVRARELEDDGSYSVSAVLLPEGTIDDHVDDAGILAVRVPVQQGQLGLIGRTGDVDVVHLKLRDGIRYRIAVRPLTLPEVRVDLLGPGGAALVPQRASSSPGGSVEFTLTATGTAGVFVRIAGKTASQVGKWLLFYDFTDPPSISVTETRSGSQLLVDLDIDGLPAAIEAMELPLEFDGDGLHYTGTAEPGPAAEGLLLLDTGGENLGYLGFSFYAEESLDPARQPRNGRLVRLVFDVVNPGELVADSFGTAKVDIVTPDFEQFSLFAPRADAGVGQSVLLERTAQGQVLPTLVDPLDPSGPRVDFVRLDGSLSADESPFPTTLTYRWSVTTSPVPVTLAQPASSVPTFAPTTPGYYEFGLKVQGGGLTSPLQAVGVEIGIANESPTAQPVAYDPATDRSTTPEEPVLQLQAGGGRVELDGGNSFDPDAAEGDALQYKWRQIDGPTVSLSPSAEDVTPSFAPTSPGNFVFELTVVDANGLESIPRQVGVLASPGATLAPLALTARAYGRKAVGAALPISVVDVQDRSLRVTLPATVTLSASLAARPSPDTTGFLQFFWQQVEGSPVSLSLPLAVVEELQSSTVFEPATAGVFEFDCLVQEQDELGQSTGVELGRRIRVVVDGLDNGVPVSVAVPRSLDAKASPAGANEPAVVRVASGGRVQLDGGRSRDLGAGADLSLFYQWTQISGPPVVLSNPFATLTTFVSPVFQDMSRPLVFALFVDDGSIRSAPALAVVEVQATSRLSSRLDLGGGANFIGVGVAPRGGPGTYYASDLALDTGASMLVRLETTPAGRRFRTFFAETGERGFLVQGNEGYLLLGSGGAQRRSLFGSAWDPSQLQRQLADGLNLVAMPRGVPEDFTVKSLATLTGARFVAYTEAVGGRARTTVYVPGLSQTSPAVVSGKSYLLSVSGSPVVSLPGR